MPAARRLGAAGKAGVDVELGIGQDAVLLVRRRRVVALVGDDARHVAALADAEAAPPAPAAPSPARRRAARRGSGRCASILRTISPSWSMCANSMTLGAPLVALHRRDEVAEPVGARGDAEPRERVARYGAGRGPRSPRGRGSASAPWSARASRLLHRHSPRAARTSRMNSAARSGSTAFQVLPSTFSDEPTMQPSATRQHVGDRRVLHAGIGEHRRVRQRRLHRLEVLHLRRLAGDRAGDEDGVGDRREHRAPRPVGEAAGGRASRRTRRRRCRAAAGRSARAGRDSASPCRHPASTAPCRRHRCR